MFSDQMVGGGGAKASEWGTPLWKKPRLQTVLCDYQIL